MLHNYPDCDIIATEYRRLLKIPFKVEIIMNKFVLKTLPCLFAAIALFQTAGFAQTVSVDVNGVRINGSAVMLDGKTYVPLREVAEMLGAEVTWDGSTNTAGIIVSNGDLAIPAIIPSVCKSVVAIAGNYKPEYMSQQAIDYKDSTAHGTGVVIKSNGTILTNAHVVENINNITVFLGDGTSHAAQIQYMDKTSDLAVIKINKLGMQPIEFASNEDIVWGSTVIAIGTPLSLSMQNTVTRGIISGVNVNIQNAYYPLIQTDAAINAGNSGGPLVNTEGRLLGINSSKFMGINIEGMAFSIPIDTVNYVLAQFEANGKVLRPDLGVELENSWEAKHGLPTQKGVTVKSSSNSNIPQNSEIVSINGIAVHSIIEYNKALRDSGAGAPIAVKFYYGEDEYNVSVQPELKEI